jgi:hypothetical protein
LRPTASNAILSRTSGVTVKIGVYAVWLQADTADRSSKMRPSF